MLLVHYGNFFLLVIRFTYARGSSLLIFELSTSFANYLSVFCPPIFARNKLEREIQINKIGLTEPQTATLVLERNDRS